MEQLKTTPLKDHHLALGAKLVDFCGWEMPLQYAGILSEHLNVRQHVGLFDVSHMGRIEVNGPQAEAYLDSLSTNHIIGKEEGTAIYTVWCHPDGGSVDDVIVYKIDSTHCFVIVNACNREKDLKHLLEHAEAFDVQIKDRYREDGILSLQGPAALEVVRPLFPIAATLKPMHFIKQQEIILSRTGYTGEDGFEFYAPNSRIVDLWNRILEAGQPHSIAPIGLGARDTLRLEKGYALYGHELSDTISPTESVAAWTVKMDKEFMGKEALQKKERTKRYAYGVTLDQGIARADYLVLKGDVKIGHVTSGTFSPSLNKGIALILVDHPLTMGEIVQIQIRQNPLPATVMPLPFIRKIR